MSHSNVQELIDDKVITQINVNTIKINDTNYRYNKHKPITKTLNNILQSIERKQSVDTHAISRTKAEHKTILKYISDNKADLLHKADKQITNDFIIAQLVKQKILTSKQASDVPMAIEHFIHTIVTKHNNTHFKETHKNEIEELNQGKYKYSISFKVKVKNIINEGNIYYHENRAGEFKSDQTKDEIPMRRLHEIIHMYYAWKDYLSIFKIVSVSIQLLDDTLDIKEMKLWDMFGRKFCNKLFKYSVDRIDEFDEQARIQNYKQCVVMFLITNYIKLVERKLINKRMLSEVCINDFFEKSWLHSECYSRIR